MCFILLFISLNGQEIIYSKDTTAVEGKLYITITPSAPEVRTDSINIDTAQNILDKFIAQRSICDTYIDSLSGIIDKYESLIIAK